MFIKLDEPHQSRRSRDHGSRRVVQSPQEDPRYQPARGELMGSVPPGAPIGEFGHGYDGSVPAQHSPFTANQGSGTSHNYFSSPTSDFQPQELPGDWPQPYELDGASYHGQPSMHGSVGPCSYHLRSNSTPVIPHVNPSLIHASARPDPTVHELWGATASDEASGLRDVISAKLNDVITGMDGEDFGGDERDLRKSRTVLVRCKRRANSRPVLPTARVRSSPYAISSLSIAKSFTSSSRSSTTNYFSKVWLYSNSRLPPYLPPCKFYLPTFPLLCVAARQSLGAYNKPRGKEREDHIAASILQGTKAMTLKSLPLDDMNTIVFAIRGSDSFLDWAVNFRPAPTPPRGFLDDEGNLCHAGFLSVARAMVKPVADRLRTLLREDPSRGAASLIITGHSAGGAVAQLLYAHMLSTSGGAASELAHLAGFFKRVHCVTFGAPPVSLLPLATPHARRHRKSLFLAFVNEGDPVARADKAVLRSLFVLLATPAPKPANVLRRERKPPAATDQQDQRAGWKKAGRRASAPVQPAAQLLLADPARSPLWEVPAAILSAGGRVVLLRERLGARDAEDVEACQVSDGELKKTVFGDPMCHTMALYARRIEILATRAATGGGVAT